MKTMTTYLVVEIRAAYAVVLDNSGRFIKTANLGYKVGDIIDKIIPLKYPENKKSRKNKIIRLAASLAACVCLCVFGIYEYQYMFVEYGSVHMQINPQIEISLSRSGRVLDIEGENADGEALLKEYRFKGKDKNTVADELTALAIEQKYLTEGGKIVISADAPSRGWSDKIESEMLDELNRYLQEQGITVEIEIGTLTPEETDDEKETLKEPQRVTIPVSPPADDTAPSDTGDDYGDDGITDYAEPSSNTPSVPPSSSAPSSPSQNDSGYDSSGGTDGDDGDSSYSGGNADDDDADSSYDD